MNRAHPVLVALLAAGLVSATAAQAVELGDASVLSQRGQRLKIAVPFGSAPGENVAVTRFAVASVVSADGRPVPAAQGFTISKPERRNVLYLQSREPVDLDRIRVEVSVSNNDVERIGYDLRVPPARYAATEAETAPAPRTVLDRRTKRRGAAR
ncbi:MAG: hypothetical protein K1X57_22730, partial [Gemmataceae bacterium]|nr:hypothetical protein [Gemmataceae bacterium]